MLLESQSGLLTGAPGFSFMWPLHVTWAFHRTPRNIITEHHFYHILLSKNVWNNSIQGEGKKILSVYELSHYLNPSYLWRKKKKPRDFIVVELIPLLFIQKLPLVDSVPPRSREFDSLLLDLLQGKNRVRISHSQWILTSRHPKASCGNL